MKLSKKIKFFFRRIRKVKKLKLAHAKIVPTPLEKINRSLLEFNASEKPKVSIIIPFYNEEIYTWNCLQFLNKNLLKDLEYEILLIDDCSPDEMDFSLAKGITIHRNEQNQGFLKNINNGIQLAKGEYIYILNNDTEVHENFLDELFYVFDNFKNVGAVGSKLLNPNKSLQEAGAVFLKNMDIWQIVLNKKTFSPEVNYIAKVDYCSGCSLLFKRRNDLGELNLFDEQFAPAYFEETDFCFQLKYIQNKEIYYTPFSEVMHFNGISYNSDTSESNNLKKATLFKNNKEKFKKKWRKEVNQVQASCVEERILEKYNTKSILFFTEVIPTHDKDSGSNRFKEIMAAFVDLGYHVTLVCQHTFIENPYLQHYQRMGINVFYEYKKYTGYKEFIIEQKLNPSLVWLYGPNPFALYFKEIKEILPASKLIYDMVDIHHLRFKRALELTPNKKSIRKNYLKYEKLEKQAATLCDYVITISDFEENYMKSICDSNKIMTISNVHYTKIDKAETFTFEDRKDILFIGSTHAPNVDALYYLYQEIMPKIWKTHPEITVNIIGNVDTLIDDIQHPNFIFHGYVPSIETFFKTNKLMIAPLRYGAGVKGKIGQSFEYFLPLVTTSIGIEGMKIKDNENAFVADLPEEFAEKVIQLYTDKEIWMKFHEKSEESLMPFSKEKVIEQISNLTK
ncbi:glycosyltransferase [Flavobacterium sp. TSSA_36]|uniref:glycosyltransferase n=1 Tax=Flavobacterium sp. TSSA_36 TaxID=3447669 RepID=UPI003F3268DD